MKFALQIIFLGAPLGLLVTTLLAHAETDYLDEIFGKPAARAESPAPRVKPSAEYCESKVSTPAPARIPGAGLELIEAKNPVEDLLINKPIEVSRLRLADRSDENRAAQFARMKEYAREVADLILSPAYLGDDDAQMKVQELLHSRIGLLPKSSMTMIDQILDANLSSLAEPNSKPRYRRDADNALAELTRVITSYRKKGVDVNTFANAASKFAGLPVIGRRFKDLDRLLRESLQSVNQAIRRNDEVLATAMVEMIARIAEMREARLECRALEIYLELAQAITEEVHEIAKQFINAREPDEAQRARFEKIVLLPLANAEGFILRNRTAVMGAYHQFQLLMDGTQDLVAIMRNVRGTAELIVKVFGAGRIISNEIETSMNLVTDVVQAIDDVQAQTIADVRRRGVRIREFPEVILRSTARMIGQLDELLVELDFAQQSPGLIRERISRANVIFKDKLEVAREKGAQFDLVGILDVATDVLSGRDHQSVESLPDLP